MTWPAFFDLHEDRAVVAKPTALRVYATLIGIQHIFHRPQPIKAKVLATRLGVHEDSIKDALKLLVSRGYLVEAERARNNVRRIMVALTRTTCPPDSSATAN